MPKERAKRRALADEAKIRSDIKAINDIRKELGKRPLPVRNDKWFKDITKYAQAKYSGNVDLAIKMISATITPYGANQLNRTKGKTTAKINTVVHKSGMSSHTLDEVIRAQDMNWFDSLQYNEMNHVQEELLKSGDLDFRQASVKVVETKLNGVRPR